MECKATRSQSIIVNVTATNARLKKQTATLFGLECIQKLYWCVCCNYPRIWRTFATKTSDHRAHGVHISYKMVELQYLWSKRASEPNRWYALTQDRTKDKANLCLTHAWYSLTTVKEGLKKYCDTAYARSGVDPIWKMKNSKELLDNLTAQYLYYVDSIKSFWFLYTL